MWGLEESPACKWGEGCGVGEGMWCGGGDVVWEWRTRVNDKHGDTVLN